MNLPMSGSRVSQHHGVALAVAFVCALGALFIGVSGCSHNGTTQPGNVTLPIGYGAESTGEEFLIGALDELGAIADWAQSEPNQHVRGGLPQPDRRLLFSKTASDSVYVYGEVTRDGYGAVVTERHAYPKGLLLITVRKSHGKSDGHIVTETRKYISYESFLNDRPQQSNSTEMYALLADTIVTYVLRNGMLETYTFRLPVITRTVNPLDGSVRITTRYGERGIIMTETRDGSNVLVQLRRNTCMADGSLITRTEYVDGSWRSVRTLGRADGSILREVTSGN